MAKHEEEAKKFFREKFYKRLADSSLMDISRATGIAPNTLYSWGQVLRGMPDIYEAELIARAKNVDPAWLAFGIGDRDADAGSIGRSVASELSKIPRERRTQILASIAAVAELPFAAPAPQPSSKPSEYPEGLPLVEEVQKVQARIMECVAAGIPADSRLDRALESAEELLGRLIVALQQAKQQGSRKDSDASDSANALSGVKSQRGRKKGRAGSA
jgi:hypothetical protein